MICKFLYFNILCNFMLPFLIHLGAMVINLVLVNYFLCIMGTQIKKSLFSLDWTLNTSLQAPHAKGWLFNPSTHTTTSFFEMAAMPFPCNGIFVILGNLPGNFQMSSLSIWLGYLFWVVHILIWIGLIYKCKCLKKI